jgi:hypothetical protein
MLQLELPRVHLPLQASCLEVAVTLAVSFRR